MNGEEAIGGTLKQLSFVAVAMAALATAPCHADSVGIAFVSSYNLSFITRPTGLAAGYGTGGLLIDPSSPNSLFIGEDSEYNTGAVVSSAIVRDPSTGNITGFNGSLLTVAAAPDIDSGLTYGPGQYLFFTKYPDNEIGEVAPGNTAYTVSTGVAASPGGLAFIPSGFGGAGKAAIASYNGNSICSAPVTLAGNGSYTFGTCTHSVSLGYYPEGVVYVPAGTDGFSSNTVLIADYSPSDSVGAVMAYQTDSNGMPILSSGKALVSGIGYADGLALDPVSGDILVSPFNDSTWDLLTPKDVAPEPSGAGLAGTGLLALAAAGWRAGRRKPGRRGLV